ncbi:type II toxin-antitoxin system HicB family antitoxin [uncultured Spirosoma sp.]|uniref:type II toxin-antitoxin system HicB family antitoxin n=1 Tax=uncultured Spirosoma sp. TaxID=278208 RepID=UPI00258F7549|nr:type II toxin-antitoxin system HicB family antitoxin [uncultured Spirosoma sp.]
MDTNPRYELIIYWSNDDHAFIVEVPELPGCMADGDTYQEAVANAEQVIQEWIETARSLGRDIPTPKGRLLFA